MIATNIQQSKHLLELGLDPKTADMHLYDIENDNPHKNDWVLMCNYCTIGDYDKATYIPAWSLSALLDVIPRDSALYKIENTYSIHHGWTTENHTNAIDAAYEMVCWLLKQGLIEKGGQDD